MPEMPPALTTSLVLLGASMVVWSLIANALREENEPMHRALWAATEPTANHVGRVGILVGLVWALYWGATQIISQPPRDSILGGALAVLAVVIASLRERRRRQRRRNIDDDAD